LILVALGFFGELLYSVQCVLQAVVLLLCHRPMVDLVVPIVLRGQLQRRVGQSESQPGIGEKQRVALKPQVFPAPFVEEVDQRGAPRKEVQTGAYSQKVV
jgi:hypothetical protein